MVRPRKLVTPVSDKVQYTHQAKKSTHTHRPTVKANIAKAPRKQKASEHSKGPKKAESEQK